MAKKKSRRAGKGGGGVAAKAKDLGQSSSDEAIGWSSIPGKRLDVDIANTVAAAPSAAPTANGHTTTKNKKRHRADNSDEDDVSSSSDQYNVEKWTSQHYDHEDDGESDDGWEENADKDLFDPDPLDKTNKFDAGSKLDGANDAGMFFR